MPNYYDTTWRYQNELAEVLVALVYYNGPVDFGDLSIILS